MDGIDIFLTCNTFPVDGILEDEAPFTTSIGVVGEQLPDRLSYNISKWPKLLEIYNNERRFKCTAGMCSGQSFPASTHQLDLIKTTPRHLNADNTGSDNINRPIMTSTSTNIIDPHPSRADTTMVTPPLAPTNSKETIYVKRSTKTILTHPTLSTSSRSSSIIPSLTLTPTQLTSISSSKMEFLSLPTMPRSNTSPSTNMKTIAPTSDPSRLNTTIPLQSPLSTSVFNEPNTNTISSRLNVTSSSHTRTIMSTSVFNISISNKTLSSYELDSVTAKCSIDYKISFFVVLSILICSVFSNIIMFRKLLKKTSHHPFPAESIELDDFV
jgi:hypothetical protein